MTTHQYELLSMGAGYDTNGYATTTTSDGSSSSSSNLVATGTLHQASDALAATADGTSVTFPQSGMAGILVPTIGLGLVLFVWYHQHRRRIQKRQSYSSIGGRRSMLAATTRRGSSNYSDRQLLLRHYNNRSGDILDDEEDDDDPLSRYANYHRLPKGASSSSSRNLGLVRRSSLHSSPKHPALERIPTFPIRLETMKLLRVVGVRMIAHGVQSPPRRVWISINDDALVWQSEFKTKLPNNIGASSLLSVRGPVHSIAWGDIKFIDVGKNTESFKSRAAAAAEVVPETTCWSILTLKGSLDLQAKSQLERDSMVSCMVSMLDEYNDGEDWRQHYYNTYGHHNGKNSNTTTTRAKEEEEEETKSNHRLTTTRGGAAVGNNTNWTAPPPSAMTKYSLMSNDSLPIPVDV